MPYPLRNPDGPGPSPDRYPPQPPSGQDETAQPGAKAGRAAAGLPADTQTPRQTGRKAALIKKLEELHGREDLIERKFSDRNWQ
jgi:hypothetical protein